MKIVRVLNTNAVVSLDSYGREIIITGAGLVLKRKKAKSWTSPAWRKFIALKSTEDNYRLQQVVREISEKYLEIARQGGHGFQRRRTEGERYPLCHVDRSHNSAVERYQSGISLKNLMRHEIRKFYPQEYRVAQEAIEWIRKMTE